MSNKGHQHTALAKFKISLANKKDRSETLKRIEEYINSLTPQDFPSITNCANFAGISEEALLNWEATTEENSKIRELLSNIRQLQKAHLIENGLKKLYDSRLTIFLLKAHHKLTDQPPNLTQNNIFNISPDILAEALKMLRDKDK